MSDAASVCEAASRVTSIQPSQPPFEVVSLSDLFHKLEELLLSGLLDIKLRILSWVI